MGRVSDEQVDFILHEIEARGVTIEDLQWSLLDHMCCIIENEMSETDNFDQFFQRLLPRFFNDNLREIQEETELLLTFKHFYAMKKILVISGLLASAFTLIGSLFKVLHWPGAGISFVLGIGIFGVIFLPLMIALKFKDEVKMQDKLVLSFGLFIGIITTFGFLFKIMHWPFANILMLSGLTSFTFAYAPLYLMSRIRRPELKFNAIVNTVLMLGCGGLLFAMFNLNKPKTDHANKSFYSLLSSELESIQMKEKVTIDSVQKGTFINALNELNNEIQGLKTDIFRHSGQISKQEFDKMTEEDAFDRMLNDQLVKQVMNDEMYARWTIITSTLQTVNQQISTNFPNHSKFKIKINNTDFEYSTTKVGVQELTLIQLHLRILESFIH